MARPAADDPEARTLHDLGAGHDARLGPRVATDAQRPFDGPPGA